MQLHQATANKIEDAPICSFSKGVIYYVHSGRNAWHSTWAARYSNGCMHATLPSAKSYAEGERKQGTKFYITQLPCLLIRNKTDSYFITEINNRTPLSGHALAIPQMPGTVTDQPVKIGASTRKALESFDPSSQFWRIRPHAKNSIMLLHYPNSSISVEKLTPEPLRSMQSRSDGPDYYLSWSNRESLADQSAVQRIYRKLKLIKSGRIKEHHAADDQKLDLA